MDADYLKMLTFLQNVDKDFPVALSAKQDLAQYARKIIEYATVCTIEADGNIAAAAIGYTERLPDRNAYLAVVATVCKYRGKGLAEKCIHKFISECRAKHIPAVHLYTTAGNTRAVKMYEKLGFRKYTPENETRPDDLHLICNLL